MPIATKNGKYIVIYKRHNGFFGSCELSRKDLEEFLNEEGGFEVLSDLPGDMDHMPSGCVFILEGATIVVPKIKKKAVWEF